MTTFYIKNMFQAFEKHTHSALDRTMHTDLYPNITETTFTAYLHLCGK